ncbi:hypothetical protein [Actinomadura citrea]|uniref:Uncharacterized protein n=1 Tax=Actinomadura citrea TaxID=46158 RepID=A0A7Y9G941_9ACTN|nr:hypothetical protein [Actinomadura citrea]NYE12177.1 hypothetical protein [Actinomadura citrea]GGT50121.1 hypothetical protein GCM10010177_02320 [Actinomadura citrea]
MRDVQDRAPYYERSHQVDRAQFGPVPPQGSRKEDGGHVRELVARSMITMGCNPLRRIFCACRRI